LTATSSGINFLGNLNSNRLFLEFKIIMRS
jgi:hypothetical protein